MALLLGAVAGPALGAKAVRPASWDALFGDGPVRLRGIARHPAVPLPRPRPADAPVAEQPVRPDVAEEPQAAPGAGKPAEQAAPAPSPTPQPSACRLALTDAVAIAPSIRSEERRVGKECRL